MFTNKILMKMKIWRKSILTFMKYFSFLLCVTNYSLAMDEVTFNTNTVSYTHLRDLNIELNGISQNIKQYFRLLRQDGDKILIGARDHIYSFNLKNLSEPIKTFYSWSASEEAINMCEMKGQTEECANFINLLVKKHETEFFICGTNAYAPECYEISWVANPELGIKFDFLLNQNSKRLAFEYVNNRRLLFLSGSIDLIKGLGFVPYSPTQTFTYVYADGNLYIGTPSSFSSVNNLIIKHSFSNSFIKTDDLINLKFIHSFEYKDHVYIVYWEKGIERTRSEAQTFTRIARVCKNDPGWKGKWTTLMKIRLTCHTKGDFRIFADEVQSFSDIVSGTYGDRQEDMFYAIFRTSSNSVSFSLLCNFFMNDIINGFSGKFHNENTTGLNKGYDVFREEMTIIQDGVCSDVVNTTLLNYRSIFLGKTSLVDNIVSNIGTSLPLEMAFRTKFSKLAVDPQVEISNGTFVDVLFITTESGKLYKIINDASTPEQMIFTIIEEFENSSNFVAINDLRIVKVSNGKSKLLIVKDDEVMSIAVHRCPEAKTCRYCVSLKDPYCAWNQIEGICGPRSSHHYLSRIYAQDVIFGNWTVCDAGSTSNNIIDMYKNLTVLKTELNEIN